MNIGIIGLGYWGSKYPRVFQELGHQITYICDKDSATLKKASLSIPDAKTSQEHNELLSSQDVDAVVISTPATSHYQIIKDVINKEKPVLVEKPITRNVQEARNIIELSSKTSIPVMVGHTFLYNPAVRKLKEIVSNGELGEIFYMHFTRTALGPVRSDISAMWDLAPHDISMFNYLTESLPKEVTATGHAWLQEDVEDVVFMTLKNKRGVMAGIHTSWIDPYKVRKVTVVGSEKMAVFDDVNQQETLRIFDKGFDKQTQKRGESYGEYLKAKRGDIITPAIEASEPLKNQCKHFIDCIQKGKTPLSDAKSGLSVVSVLDAAEKSLNQNGAAQKLSAEALNGGRS